jgi:hypothetical protein
MKEIKIKIQSGNDRSSIVDHLAHAGFMVKVHSKYDPILGMDTDHFVIFRVPNNCVRDIKEIK